MNTHKHARLTAKSRALLVERVTQQRWHVAAASEAAGISIRTGYKWLASYLAEGLEGLSDRSSRPHRSPRALSDGERTELERLRRQRWPLWRLAQQLPRGLAKVSRCMKRLGLSRLRSLEAPEAAVRYERAPPGGPLHIDIKKLGKHASPALKA